MDSSMHGLTYYSINVFVEMPMDRERHEQIPTDKPYGFYISMSMKNQYLKIKCEAIFLYIN